MIMPNGKFHMPSKDGINWVGLHIDSRTLEIRPLPVAKKNMLATLTVNMKTKHPTHWLKNKFKSFVLNNYTVYFHGQINSKQTCLDNLHVLFMTATEKFVTCCKEFKLFY